MKAAEKIKLELLVRIEKLCKTKPNGKNLFTAINEHAISLVNYYIGILKIESENFANLDELIRLILNKNKIILKPTYKEGFCLPNKNG
ncbi:hypothetical protein NUSPORA_01495 [Nucleospora cyclopteri]